MKRLLPFKKRTLLRGKTNFSTLPVCIPRIWETSYPETDLYKAYSVSSLKEATNLSLEGTVTIWTDMGGSDNSTWLDR